MQWIFLFTGLLILLLVRHKAFRPSPPPFEQFKPEGTLNSYMEAAAQQIAIRGTVRLRPSKRILSQLERSISYLNHLPEDKLLPASRQLCLNSRFLQEETIKSIRSQRNLPRLPHTIQKSTRIAIFARTLLAFNDALFTQAELTDALSAWQNVQPLTEAELDSLPLVLRFQLLERACLLASQCEMDQRAQASAYRAHLMHKRRRLSTARKIILRFSNHTAFLESLFRYEEPADWMGDKADEWKEKAEALVRQERQRQTETKTSIDNILQSLRMLNLVPWECILENASVIHTVLKQDPVYSQMDDDSRKYYRELAAKIAKKARTFEQTVCDGILSLCRKAPRHSIAAHTGYYLLDDGVRDLLQYLHSFTLPHRIFMFFQKHACAAFRLFSWLFVFMLLVLGFRFRLPVVLLVPFAFLLGQAVQHTVMHILSSKPRRLPRMNIRHLSPDEQILVVCPVVLSSVQQALSAVKDLAVMHEANHDEHLHFLLLGDFQDSLTATLSIDTEIVSTASAAIQALCSDRKHPFLYLQRERIYSPTEKSYHSRERRRGALETILCLISGRAIQDRFAFSSFDPSALKGRYRYVIIIDSNTILPPGSALRMAGAMMHPLQKREVWNGRMRGSSILQPRMNAVPHAFTTNFSRFVIHDENLLLLNDIDRLFSDGGTFEGNAIIDPEPYLDETAGVIPEERILNHSLIEGMLAGCKFTDDIQLHHHVPTTLRQWGNELHRQTKIAWQLLPWLIPYVGYDRRWSIKRSNRLKIWHNAMLTLIAPIQLLLLLYASASGRELLTAAIALIPGIPLLFTRKQKAWLPFLSRLALLPCEAYIRADAIVRTLYRLLISRQHLLEDAPAVQLASSTTEKSMLFFTLNMSCAGVCAALAFLFDGAIAGLAPALLWAAFPFLLPALEQERTESQHLTTYMRDVLMRLAQKTWLFFETAITESDHGLPSENIQIEPNTGISHTTTPVSVGLYLCSLISAQKLGIIRAQDMADRMDETIQSLETLPKWYGLFYNLYDTRTLAPCFPTNISSSECGILAVCLLTCAQGIRTLLAEESVNIHELSERIDRLCFDMQLSRLYDNDARLFFTGVDPISGSPSHSHFDLLAGENRLLSYVSIMLGQVSHLHWLRLSRQQTAHNVLISQNGSMAEYILPLLFQPLVPDTLLERSCKRYFTVQRRHRLGRAYGVSKSAYHQFDPHLRYKRKPFGLSGFALDTEVKNNVLAPYASMLCLTIDAKSVFHNLQRMQLLGLEGPLGLFEAADFSNTGGEKKLIVRSHTAPHQGMILCALCNALADGYLKALFSSLPRAKAYTLLLEEPFKRQRPWVHQPQRRT